MEMKGWESHSIRFHMPKGAKTLTATEEKKHWLCVGWCWNVKWLRFVMISKDLEHSLERSTTELICCHAAATCSWL